MTKPIIIKESTAAGFMAFLQGLFAFFGLKCTCRPLKSGFLSMLRHLLAELRVFHLGAVMGCPDKACHNPAFPIEESKDSTGKTPERPRKCKDPRVKAEAADTPGPQKVG